MSSPATTAPDTSPATPANRGDFVEAAGPAAANETANSRAKKWNAGMRFVRRIHLYSGLFMFPWVLLYGTTGMFFNHPQWFQGGQTQSFAAGDVADGKLQGLPQPDQLAQAVVTELNTQLQESGDELGEPGDAASPRVVLTEDRPAQYDRELAFTIQAEEATHSVAINPLTGDGTIRTEPKAAEDSQDSNPLAEIRGVVVEEQQNPQRLAEQALPSVLDELGLPGGTIQPARRGANLRFSATIDGKPVALSYNLGNGQLNSTMESAPAEMSTKTFLQRMHLSRGYSPHWNTRSYWAILVDLMFVSLVFWGFSGIFMWWQIKRTRWLGAATLVVSLAMTTWMTAAMHDQLTVAGSRGQGGHGHGGAGGNVEEGGPRGGGRGMRGGRGGFGRGGNRGGGFGRGGMRGNRGGEFGGGEFGRGNRGGGEFGGGNRGPRGSAGESSPPAAAADDSQPANDS